ncbi:hypothetical protein FJ934_04790 [Mesorhizobium sp. B2-4-12]|uniref:hypothetical protein n=1 Tax=unclassified Mesorhizobium TaxID=325217 RepID=UPI00112C3BE8|nr:MULTISPECIES: hypothetical protein [unclassified Mesorhizobium]TPK98051.1 hypothetical protein FJ934_04790 [Mesorhizobium sp. B2-4-12]TPL06493.1 hypothetical protein FJ938_13590 [Mesorhizobium sp. B2-4-14]
MPTDSERRIETALDQISGQIAALAGIISQLPDTQRLDRGRAKREANNFLSSPNGRRHAEKLIDDLLPAFPKKGDQGQG